MDDAGSSGSAMELARKEAIRLGHEYVGTEHQLLGLLRAGDAEMMQLIESHGVTADKIRAALLETLPAGTPGLLDPDAPLPYTTRARRVLDLSAAESGPAEQRSECIRLLHAFFTEDRNIAAAVLRQMGFDSV